MHGELDPTTVQYFVASIADKCACETLLLQRACRVQRSSTGPRAVCISLALSHGG